MLGRLWHGSRRCPTSRRSNQVAHADLARQSGKASMAWNVLIPSKENSNPVCTSRRWPTCSGIRRSRSPATCTGTPPTTPREPPSTACRGGWGGDTAVEERCRSSARRRSSGGSAPCKTRGWRAARWAGNELPDPLPFVWTWLPMPLPSGRSASTTRREFLPHRSGGQR